MKMTLQTIMQKMTSYVELVLSRIFAAGGRCAERETHRTECAAGVVAADRRHVLSGKCDDAGDRD